MYLILRKFIKVPTRFIAVSNDLFLSVRTVEYVKTGLIFVR